MFYRSCNGLGTTSHLQFGKDAFDVEADGSFSDSEDLADLPIGFSVLHPIENCDFSRGQFIDASICSRGSL